MHLLYLKAFITPQWKPFCDYLWGNDHEMLITANAHHRRRSGSCGRHLEASEYLHGSIWPDPTNSYHITAQQYILKEWRDNKTASRWLIGYFTFYLEESNLSFRIFFQAFRHFLFHSHHYKSTFFCSVRRKIKSHTVEATSTSSGRATPPPTRTPPPAPHVYDIQWHRM